MNKTTLPRLGAACGIVFPIALFLADGSGGQLPAWREVLSVWALALALPFLAALYRLLRSAEGEAGWLANAALVAGVSGFVLKLSSGVPELAVHQEHFAKGTSSYKLLDSLSNGATLISLYPLAMCCAAIAAVSLRNGALPRWLGAFAGVTAGALAVNGAFISASFVPAIVLFLLWVLIAALVLFWRAERLPRTVAYAQASAN